MAWTQCPLETTDPKIEVTLPVGRHVLELIVEDSAGLRSAPATVVITVQKAEEVTVSVEPTSAQLSARGTQQFKAKVTGTADTDVVWGIKEGAEGGTITKEGLYTAPATDGTYHVTAASAADKTASATAEVTVKAVSPCAGGTPRCVAALPLEICTGAPPKCVSASPATTCSGSTPITLCTGATPVIRCLAGQPGVVEEVSVSITPDNVTLENGDEQQFTATVTGSDNKAVTWKADKGSINANGLYKATTVGTDKVTATCAADPAKSAAATVTVTLATLCTGATPKIVECTGATPRLEVCTAARPKILTPVLDETPTRSVEKTDITAKTVEKPAITPKTTIKTKPKK